MRTLKPSEVSKLSILAMLIGIILVLWVSATTSIWWVPTEYQIGIFQMLPPLFWVGLSLMIISVFISCFYSSEKLFFFEVCILFVVISNIFLLFTPNVHDYDSLYHFNHSTSFIEGNEYVCERYVISPSYKIGFESYQEYPSFFILFAQLFIIITPDPIVFTRLFTIFSSIFTLTAIYLFSQSFLSGIRQRLSLIIISFLNVWFILHFSPQSIAFPTALLLFAFIKRYESTAIKVVVLLLFIYLVTSHPLTTIIVVVIFAFFALPNKNYLNSNSPRQDNRLWFGTLFVVFLAWFLYQGAISSESLITRTISNIKYFFAAGEILYTQSGAGTYYLVPLLRLLVVIFIVAISGLIIILLFLTEKRKNVMVTAPFWGTAIMASGSTFIFGAVFIDRGLMWLMTITPILIFYYLPDVLQPPRKFNVVKSEYKNIPKREYTKRNFRIKNLPTANVSKKNNLVNNTKKIFILLLIVSIILFSGRYYSDGYTILSDSAIREENFIISKVKFQNNNSNVLIIEGWNTYHLQKGTSNISYLPYESSVWYGEQLSRSDLHIYLSIDKYGNATIPVMRGLRFINYTLYIEEAENGNFIYNNGAFKFYEITRK